MTRLHEHTAVEQRELLRRGEVSPSDLAAHYLDRVERLDDRYGAFLTVTADAARQRAAALEAAGDDGTALWGLPSGDKDLWARAGVRCTYGSRLTAENTPEASDEIVETLDAAGAVSLGKTNAPEFGMPCYTETLIGPPARNPWDPTLNAGGSSGGAAAAVAAALLPFAPGSDGGGSVRIPAAACGLVGLKPSRGLVPAGSGVDALAGLVVDGPLARTVADAALLLDGMIRRVDGRIDHHYTLRAPGGGPYLPAAQRGEPGRLSLGVTTDSAWDLAYDIRLDPGARAALADTTARLAALGHDLDETTLEPDPAYADAFRTVWQSGAANIPAEGDALALLEPLTRWLIETGRGIPAPRLAAALATLTAYERRFLARFARYDAVLTPALAMTPRPHGWYDHDDPERNFEQQCQYTPYTAMVNVVGLPAIVLPVAQTETGLPLGVQVIGRPGGEETLLALGAQLERELDWAGRLRFDD